MNIAYFRKSSRDYVDTLASLRAALKEAGFSPLGESSLPGGNAAIINICRPEWARTVIDADPQLLGLLPCSVSVIEKGKDVLVGAPSPAILGQAAPTQEIADLVEKAEASLRSLVETAAGVGPMKPTKLKLYSSHSCPYCKMEKSWLDGKKAAYDLVYVDDDQKEAEELVRRTGQMGVPVTEVAYEGGESEFIVGFDRAKLEKVVTALSA